MDRRLLLAAGVILTGHTAGHYAFEVPHSLAAGVSYTRHDDHAEAVVPDDGPEYDGPLLVDEQPGVDLDMSLPLRQASNRHWPDEADFAYARAGGAMVARMMQHQNHALLELRDRQTFR